MKKPNKYVLMAFTAGLLLLALIIYRITGYAGCVIDQYNLKRTTHFSLVTGACTVDTSRGRVYIKSIRGFDSDADSSN